MANKNKILIIATILIIVGAALTNIDIISAKTGNTIIGNDITNVQNISAERGDFNNLTANHLEANNISTNTLTALNNSNNAINISSDLWFTQDIILYANTILTYLDISKNAIRLHKQNLLYPDTYIDIEAVEWLEDNVRVGILVYNDTSYNHTDITMFPEYMTILSGNDDLLKFSTILLTPQEITVKIENGTNSTNYKFNETAFDMNNKNIINCANCEGNQNLSQVLIQGNSAGSTNIDMNGKNIQNLNSISETFGFNQVYTAYDSTVPTIRSRIYDGSISNYIEYYLTYTAFSKSITVDGNITMNGNITGCLNCANSSLLNYIFDGGKNVNISGNQQVPNDTFYNKSWSNFTRNDIPNGSRPLQISLNISNSTGTNNKTHVYCNGYCSINFTDIMFVLNNETILSHWVEDNSTGKVWINITGNGIVDMYYGNPNAPYLSNGSQTFPFFDDFSIDLSKWTISGTGIIENGRLKLTSNPLTTAIGNIPFDNGTLEGAYYGNAFSNYEYHEIKFHNDSTHFIGARGIYGNGYITGSHYYLGAGENSINGGTNSQSGYIKVSRTGQNTLIQQKTNLSDNWITIGTSITDTMTSLYPACEVYNDISYIAYFDNIFVYNYVTMESSWSTWLPANSNSTLISHNLHNLSNIYNGSFVGDIWVGGDVSAQSFTDRTPYYEGNAIEELTKINGNPIEGIYHSTLPNFAKSSDGQGRDLGAMISILVDAIKELVGIDTDLQRQINEKNLIIAEQQRIINNICKNNETLCI